MLIPNLPFGYKTRDWWAKAIKQIAESAASILPSRSSADAGKVLKVDSSGDLEWADDSDNELPAHSAADLGKALQVGSNNTLEWKEPLPEGGQLGDVLTKTVTGPGWFPPAKELPVSTAGDAGKALIVDQNGEPEWGTKIEGAEGAMVSLESVSDEQNAQGAKVELFHDEESGYTDTPSIYAGVYGLAGDAEILMRTKNGPKIEFIISDGVDDYAPELAESPTVWTDKSLVTLEKVEEMIQNASSSVFTSANTNILSGNLNTYEEVV